ISSLLPPKIAMTPSQQVDGMFGRGFYDALSPLPIGKWAGPILSGFGLHLVHVDAIEDPVLPQFEQISDDVLFDWRRELKSELSDAQLSELKSKFEISMRTPEQLRERLSQ
ncbi:MAG: hypothetical protein ABJJ37_21485, partial [Roseibium sp.]